MSLVQRAENVVARLIVHQSRLVSGAAVTRKWCVRCMDGD